MHGLHTVDKSQNRNNSRPQAVDNLVDGVDRYASIHRFGIGMNMQKKNQAAKMILAVCFWRIEMRRCASFAFMLSFSSWAAFAFHPKETVAKDHAS